MEHKIAIIGYFGYVNNQIDGQTIKTRELHSLIQKKAPDKILTFYDTQKLQDSPLYMLPLLRCAWKANILIYLPGKRSLLTLFPFLFLLSKIKKQKLIYPVVGGWLSEFIEKKKWLQYMLRKLTVVLVESHALANRLVHTYHYQNIQVFPNFRTTTYKPIIETHTDLRIVFMARIMKEKGCDYIFDFAKHHLSKANKKSITISFYGPINEQYKEEFLHNINEYKFMQYGGIVPPQKVYKILNQNDVLILPTYYDGEGFPGSIIDAYIAGIPVIVSRWKDLPEYVEERKTGFTFNLQNKTEFFSCIDQLLESPELLYNMKVHAREKSKEYCEETAWKIIRRYIE